MSCGFDLDVLLFVVRIHKNFFGDWLKSKLEFNFFDATVGTFRQQNTYLIFI